MAAWNYEACHARTLSHEGGWSNHPADPGGVTLEGVTQAVYDSYRSGKGLPRKALFAAMRTTPEWIAERRDIYRTLYWDKVCGDALPAGVDLAVYDYAVNSGVARAARVLQRLVAVTDDGRIGPVTLAALARHDPATLVERICDERLAFLKRLKTWPVFGKGWGRRVADVRRAAAGMARAAAPPAAAAKPSVLRSLLAAVAALFKRG